MVPYSAHKRQRAPMLDRTYKPPRPNQVVIDVEPYLTDEPRTARDIWKRLGVWAPQSVRNALDILVAQGKAVRSEERNRYGHVRHLFRRVADA